jgi:hypothetical protein
LQFIALFPSLFPADKVYITRLVLLTQLFLGVFLNQVNATGSDYSKVMALLGNAETAQVVEAFEILAATATSDALYALNKVMSGD